MTPYNASDMIRSMHQTYGAFEVADIGIHSPIWRQRWLVNLVRRRISMEGSRPR